MSNRSDARSGNDTSSSGTEQDETIVDPEEFDEPPITMECTECGLSGDVPGTWEGLRIECKDCGERFTVRPADSDTERGGPSE